MSELPSAARVVVIGAGIVGSALAWHLAELGWPEIVLLDQGPMPRPGGSTGHASNFIFPVDHSKEMTRFTQESVRQYRDLGVFTGSGGIEVARTPARLEELKRRMASATAWGEPAALVTPAEIVRMVPYVDAGILLGGFYSPGAGVVDPVRAATLMRERAMGRQALRVIARAAVIGVDARGGRVRGVRTTLGAIAAEAVAICCGVWSPRLARMAGASIPLTPAVHQMITAGPVPRFAATTTEIDYPIVRDMDAGMYARQRGEHVQIGSYAHRPMLVSSDDIAPPPEGPSSQASPTELPFTAEDFAPQLAQARALMPGIFLDPRVEIRQAINGLLALTADGAPILGESPEVRGLWCAAAVWIKEAPGMSRAVAEWMSGGVPQIDPRPSDVARFHDHARSRAHVCARAAEAFNKTYGIVHPAEQWSSARGVRLGPLHARGRELGAVFFETAGWERPQWYEANRGLLDTYGDRVMARAAEWDSRWWSPIVHAEHLALRERVGLVDLSAFGMFDLLGPGALRYIQGLVVSQMAVAVGRVVYTSLLDAAGGISGDLTVMRIGADHFRVVTGSVTAMVDRKWLADRLPTDGLVQLHDVTSAWGTIGLWGPRAREVLASVAEGDVSNAGFPFATCRVIDVGEVRTLASRISYVGELGWELHVAVEQAQRLWDLLWEAGQSHGIVPVGIGVYGTTARLEKGYRAYGLDLEPEFTLVEAGLARVTVKPEDFIGREAYLRQRGETPAALLCTLTVDRHVAPAGGTPRYMLGREPILAPDGAPLVDRKGRRSYVTSAGSGPSIGKHILFTYLPAEQARVGAALLVEYFGERYPVTVAAVGNRPLFDPDNTRVRI